MVSVLVRGGSGSSSSGSGSSSGSSGSSSSSSSGSGSSSCISGSSGSGSNTHVRLFFKEQTYLGHYYSYVVGTIQRYIALWMIIFRRWV